MAAVLTMIMQAPAGQRTLNCGRLLFIIDELSVDKQLHTTTWLSLGDSTSRRNPYLMYAHSSGERCSLMDSKLWYGSLGRWIWAWNCSHTQNSTHTSMFHILHTYDILQPRKAWHCIITFMCCRGFLLCKWLIDTKDELLFQAMDVRITM